MFSTANYEGGPARGTRSSRRRQRPAGQESIAQQPKAKRQRVPLGETTFVNPDAAPEMYEVKPDKIDLLGIKRDGIENFGTTPRKELSVRSKKPKPGERVSKGDGSIILTTNSAYTVSKLPALPDRIRKDDQNRQHGSVNASNEYALSLTHTHAYVWPYASTTPSPETFVFNLPYPSKHAADPLPLGSLVAPSAASDEPGLVVVMPVTGRITYWETVSSATLEFIREQRTGVEDSVPGMYSGEHVTQILNADPVGFVLAFSSGRLAHLNVRDGHGKPGISVQFFRNSPGHNTGGFFGSLRNALGSSSLRGQIAAVRAGPALHIGERVIAAATSKGKLHSWKVHRSGSHDFLAEVDIRDEVVQVLKEADPSLADVPNDLLEILDFTFVPRGLEKKYMDASHLSGARDDAVQHLLLLATLNTKTKPRYSLIEIMIQGGDCRVGLVRPLKSYKSPFKSSAPERPRLHLPWPGLVAFVVFDRAVVVASLASTHDSPTAQLRNGNILLSSTFEDVIDLEDVGHVQIVGSGVEEPVRSAAGQDENRGHRYHKAKNPAVALLVQGVGVVRVMVTDIDRFASEKPPEVTAKSKLEQAVFFGIKNDNPLAFRGRRVLPFTNRDVGNAAVELSHEIVTSKTQLMTNAPASLENNLKTRLLYLDRLIFHLNALEVKLDERAKWMLLYNAEKMSVAIWVWQKAEEFLAQRPKTRASKNLVAEIIVCINESQKTEPRLDVGEVDPVRYWFMNDVWRMELFLAWCYQIIKQTWKERNSEEGGIARLLWEAMTVQTGAFKEAFEYRKTHVELYGLPSQINEGGEVIPVPWTSSTDILSKVKRLIELCHQWLAVYFPEPAPKIELKMIEEIRAMLPTLVGQYFTVLNEFTVWAKRSSDDRIKEQANSYRNLYTADIVPKIMSLKDFDLWDEAVDLAIQFESWEALARLMTEQIQALEQRATSRNISASDAEVLKEEAEAKKRQLGTFIDKYKKDFASWAFTCLWESCGVQDVLDFPYGKKEFKTSFLREKPELAKVSWINDVDQENDIEQAAETLLDLGTNHEQQVWNKKIELSLGKLALLAQESTEQAGPDGSVSSRHSDAERRKGVNLERIDHELAIIKIQDDLYSQILPSIIDAVDEAAALELAEGKHTGHLAKQQRELRAIFEKTLGRLIKHEVLSPSDLIDLLTLVSLDRSHVTEIGDQFFLALKIAENGLKGTARTDAQRLVWRRCYLRDDWKKLNVTNLKNDRAVLDEIGETALYSTLFSIFLEDPTRKSSPPILKPTEVVGVFINTLDSRFDGEDEDYRNRILQVMKWEDQQLRTFIDKHQLETWQASVLNEASSTVEDAYARQNEEGANEEEGNSSAFLENGSAGGGSGNGKPSLFDRVNSTLSAGH